MKKRTNTEIMNSLAKEKGVKVGMLLSIHFPGFLKHFSENEDSAISNLHCNKCIDKTLNLCSGLQLSGEEVVKCMADQATMYEIHFTEPDTHFLLN